MTQNTFKVALAATLISLCLYETSYAQSETPADTVIINFGHESKIMIHINNPEDLDALIEYDINNMLKDLKVKIEESNGDIDYLKIEDEGGERYLKDTTIEIRQEELASLEKDTTTEDSSVTDESAFQKSFVIEAPGFSNKDKVKSKHSFNVELGMNNYVKGGDFSGTSTEDYAVKPFGSWYVALTSKRKVAVTGPLFFEWGGGISWYNFKLEDPQFRILKGEESVVFQKAEPGLNGKKSKITASFVNISFVPFLDFSNGRRKESLSFSEGPVKITKYNRQGFRVGVGPYMGYRLGSHTKFKYTDDDGTNKDKDRGSFYLNNFRYGVRFQIGYKGLDLFANYDLNPLFDKKHGPDLNAFSFGIVL